MSATRHPFRCRDVPPAGGVRVARGLSRPAAARARSGEGSSSGSDCCLVQGSQCSSSSAHSLVALAHVLFHRGVKVLLLLPDPLEGEAALAAELDGLPHRSYQTAAQLRDLVAWASPTCLLLSSHDARFEALRRDARTLRWTHEVPRCFDPQASRCTTPLFATAEGPCMKLPGFAGLARSFRHWDCRDARVCGYTPGPVRVLGMGNMADPRSNFKAFQVLAEKFRTMQFVWHGATRDKWWGNMQFCTHEVPVQDLMETSDLLVWCADNDPCPLPVFEALYLGVRVMLFEKSFSFGLRQLYSSLDGSLLLSVCGGSPQHAPLHVVGKNPKAACDVARARTFVRETVGVPPVSLLRALEERLDRSLDESNDSGQELLPGPPRSPRQRASLEEPRDAPPIDRDRPETLHDTPGDPVVASGDDPSFQVPE